MNHGEQEGVMSMRTGESMKADPRPVVYDTPELIDSTVFWVAVSLAAAACTWLICRYS